MRLALLSLALCGACSSGGPIDSPADTDVSVDTDVASDPANRDGECVFNRECPADQRCTCVDYACGCADGARGTGVNGVDTCVTGDDCASSLCVEGSGPAFYCTDECTTSDQCGGALPDCLDVAYIGRICVRSGG